MTAVLGAVITARGNIWCHVAPDWTVQWHAERNKAHWGSDHYESSWRCCTGEGLWQACHLLLPVVSMIYWNRRNVLKIWEPAVRPTMVRACCFLSRKQAPVCSFSAFNSQLCASLKGCVWRQVARCRLFLKQGAQIRACLGVKKTTSGGMLVAWRTAWLWFAEADVLQPSLSQRWIKCWRWQ